LKEGAEAFVKLPLVELSSSRKVQYIYTALYQLPKPRVTMGTYIGEVTAF